MNKKGLTLTELLLVIVIIAIITIIAVPGIMDALSESRKRGGESVEKLVLKNLELYNSDKEEDLWCLEEEGFNCDGNGPTCLKISIEKLFQMNPDIDMGECLFKNLGTNNNLFIEKLENGNYKFYTEIVCGKQLKDSNKDKIADSLSNDIYYQTPNLSLNKNNCV